MMMMGRELIACRRRPIFKGQGRAGQGRAGQGRAGQGRGIEWIGLDWLWGWLDLFLDSCELMAKISHISIVGGFERENRYLYIHTYDVGNAE